MMPSREIFNELCKILDPGKPAFAPKKGKPSVVILLSRYDQKEAISILIGIIPAGSDNSLVWTVLGVRDPVSAAIAIVKIRYAFTLSKEINESFKQSSQARTKLLSGVQMNVHVLITGFQKEEKWMIMIHFARSEIKDLSKAIVLCRVPHHQNYSLIVELIFVGMTMMMFTVFDELIGWFYKYGLDSWSGQIRGHIRPLRALDPVYRAKLGALLGIATMADCFISISSDHSEPSVGGPSTDPRPAHPPVLAMPHPVAEIVPS
ncbi:hypothetical protein AgCh_017374 [Apium graveolens]